MYAEESFGFLAILGVISTSKTRVTRKWKWMIRCTFLTQSSTFNLIFSYATLASSNLEVLDSMKLDG